LSKRAIAIGGSLFMAIWCVFTLSVEGGQIALLFSSPVLFPVSIWLARLRHRVALGHFAGTATGVALLFSILYFGAGCAVIAIMLRSS
jgi:hypothetical protein